MKALKLLLWPLRQLFILVTRPFARRTGKVGGEILDALNEAGKSLNLDQLCEATGRKDYMVTSALELLQSQGWITGFDRSKIRQLNRKTTLFRITREGQQVVREWRE